MARPSTSETGDGRRGRRGVTALVSAPIVLLVGLSFAADALTTTWADAHPLALMALNSRNRILLLATNHVDAVSYYVVGTIRLLLTDPLWYVLGWLHGVAALQWFARRSEAGGQLVRWMDRYFNKAAWPFVLVAPNPIISVLAGAARMNVAVFLSLDLVGTIGRLVLIRAVGDVFSSPIDSVLDFFKHYRIPLLIASILLVALNFVRGNRSPSGELGQLRALTDDAATVADMGGDLTVPQDDGVDPA